MRRPGTAAGTGGRFASPGAADALRCRRADALGYPLHYLELVDWTGRAFVSGKRGQVPPGKPKILDRLGIDGERFIAYAERILTAFGSAVGAPEALADLCARGQTKYLRGMQAARQLFLSRQAA